MQRTGIEYLTHTWNPLAMRCTKCSPGCDHCWHLSMAKRIAGNGAISAERRAAYAGGPPVLIREELEAPLRLRKPARIGVQFMGDPCHPSVIESGYGEQFATGIANVAADREDHTFLLLTKRPENYIHLLGWMFLARSWSMRNLLLGVTVCNQAEADAKIPVLLQLKADHPDLVSTIFISVEPMLEPIDVGQYLYPERPALDWVICGAETGPGARAMNPEWARSLSKQCSSAGVPFFFKRDSLNRRTLYGKIWNMMPEAVS